MNGIESTTRIREMDDLYFRTVPIIAFTASGMLDATEMVVQSGMNDIITKPFVAEEMQSKITKYIHASRRPLFVNFDLYTQGDADYKKELISLLIDNLDELQRSISNASSQDGLKTLNHVFHKIKIAISILNDPELTRVLEEVKVNCVGTDAIQFIQHKLRYVDTLCERIKESLLQIDSDQRGKPFFGVQNYTIPPAA
jgi:response regulator RpfG family c-di-GMP phosphodiesterase